ncbi:MAG: amino-acid N-acetyltransferase [Treponema sp.]|nr:amino-acid N-acetyltransferase [Treponema sp.]
MITNTPKKARSIRSVIRYLQKFKNALIVIYLDDKTITSPLYSSHIKDIALLHQSGIKVIIIPGARSRIDQILKEAGISWSYNDNIRITSSDAMPLIKMAAFDVSNTIMTSLAAHNITAIIGNWVRSRSKGILNGVDFGTAGEIDKIETESIKTVLNDGFIPIFPCIGWNSVGHPYNISSIHLAQQVAGSLKADKLFFVMQDGGISSKKYIFPENQALSENGDIPAMTLEETDEFLEKIHDKTITLNPANNSNSIDSDILLLKTAKAACLNGVSRVHIVDGKLDGVLPCEIFSDLGSGTMIYTSNYGKIRKSTQQDIPTILSIMRPFIESGKLLERNEASISSALDDYVVYEIDGGIHGCASLHLYDDNQAEIAAVAVDESFSNMGIGVKLVEYLTAEAKNKKAKSIFIMTTQASDWFEKLGFFKDSIETLPEERKSIWTPERNSQLYRKTKWN